MGRDRWKQTETKRNIGLETSHQLHETRKRGNWKETGREGDANGTRARRDGKGTETIRGREWTGTGRERDVNGT